MLTQEPGDRGGGSTECRDMLIEMIPEKSFFIAVSNGGCAPVIFFSILFRFFVVRLEEERRRLMGDWFSFAAF